MLSVHCKISLESRDRLTFILEENTNLNILFSSSLLTNGSMDSGTLSDDMRVEVCLSFLWGPSVLGGVDQEGSGVIQSASAEGKQEQPSSTALTVVCGRRFKIQRPPQMDEVQRRQLLRASSGLIWGCFSCWRFCGALGRKLAGGQKVPVLGS